LKQYAAMNLEAFPDARVTVEDQTAKGDMVVTRWRVTGTHTGELMGILPTGRRIEISGVTINRFPGADRRGLVPERRPRDAAAAGRDPFARRGFLRVLRRDEPQLRNPIHRSSWSFYSTMVVE
jgi:hypothetical protein